MLQHGARRHRSKPSLAHRVAAIVRSIGREQQHAELHDANPRQEPGQPAPIEQLFVQGVALTGRLLDVHGETGLAKVRTLLADLPEKEAAQAHATLSALGQTAAEEANPAGFGQLLGLPADPSCVRLFAIPIGFFAKDASRSIEEPRGQLGMPQHRELWRVVSTALRSEGLLAEDCFTIMHSFLHDPAKLASAGLDAVRAYPRVMAESYTRQAATMPLGHFAEDLEQRYALSPVLGKCLVGALVVGQDQDTFLDIDLEGEQDDPSEHAVALDGLVQTLEGALGNLFPQWNVGVLAPRPLFEAAVDTLMTLAEYWAVEMARQAFDRYENLDVEALRATVALVRERGPAADKMLVQLALCDVAGTVLGGATLPLHGLQELCDLDDLPHMFGSVLEAILHTHGARLPEAQIGVIRGVRDRQVDALGRDLFFTFSDKLARKPVSCPEIAATWN